MLQKALYGCINSALLFYQKLVGDLKSIGFKLNPYDPCVANKVICDHQCTICWHVDDFKVSHWDLIVVTGIVDWFKGIYGNVRCTRGRKHNYLGMEIEYTDNGKAIFMMTGFLKRAIGNFSEEIIGRAASPAAEHLFTVRDESDQKVLDK